MTTEDIVIQIFCCVDDQFGRLPKHRQATLYPSEIATIGILFALKGGHFRAFDRWLRRDDAALFGGLPDRTRLLRLLATHRDEDRRLLAQPSLFTVIDSYPIELLFPLRPGRWAGQVGKKGRDKGRGSVGLKCCWVLHATGPVVTWDWDTMNVPAQTFHPLITALRDPSIVLADWGFRRQEGVPDTCKLGKRGTWNERLRVETALLLVTVVCDLKRLHHRVERPSEAHLAAVMAMLNVLLLVFHQGHPDAPPFHMSIAEFSL